MNDVITVASHLLRQTLAKIGTSAMVARLQAEASPPVRIRLTRKLANVLNGVDLRSMTVGEIVELPDHFGDMLVAEGWAEASTANSPATADDRTARGKRSTRERLNDLLAAPSTRPPKRRRRTIPPAD